MVQGRLLGVGLSDPLFEDDPEVGPVLRAFRDCRNAEQVQFERVCQELDLRQGDLNAVLLLIRAKREGVPVRQKELADVLGLSHASLSVLADRLGRSGYVQRVVHPAGRRSHSLTVSDDGEERVERVIGHLRERIVEAAMGLREGERDATVGFLRRLTAALGRAPNEVPSGSELQS